VPNALPTKWVAFSPLAPLAAAVALLGLVSLRIERAVQSAEARLNGIQRRSQSIARLREGLDAAAPAVLIAYYEQLFAEEQLAAANTSTLVLSPAPAPPRRVLPQPPKPPPSPRDDERRELVSDDIVKTLPAGVASKDAADELIARLSQNQDFRARVQAALALGSSASKRAKDALVHALDDSNATVRAAVVAALGRLGDASALGALQAHSQDPSVVVRKEIERVTSILDPKARAPSEPAVFVRVAPISGVDPALASAAYAKLVADLSDQHGVRMAAEPGADSSTWVQIRGTLKTAEADDSGVSRVVIELVVLDKANNVRAKITGRTSMAQAPMSAEDWRDLVGAAVDSAARRLPAALQSLAKSDAATSGEH